MLSKSLFECSFSHAYVIFPCFVFVCYHFSVVDNASGEAVTVQRAVSFMQQLHDFGAGMDVLALRTFLLCLLMMEAMSSVDSLKMLRNLWVFGKCLLISLRNV